MGATEEKPASEPTATSRSTYRGAIENLRSVVKQGITAFAAVAAVLVGTSPLTNLGKLPAFDGRWWAAMLAAAVALAAVLLVIARAATILAPREFRLNAPSRGAAEAIRTSGLLSSARVVDVVELDRAWEAARQKHVDGVAEMSSLPVGQRAEAGRKAVEGQRESERLGPVVERVREYALWYEVSAAWRAVRWQLLGAAGLAGLAIVLYAWAANPPDPTSGAGAASTPRPTAVTVIVDPDAQERFGAALGAECAANFDAIAIGRSEQTYDLIVTDEACSGLSRTSVTHGIDVTVAAREAVEVGTSNEGTNPADDGSDVSEPDATDPDGADADLPDSDLYLLEGESWGSTTAGDATLYLCGSTDTADTTDTIVSLSVGERHTVVSGDGERTVHCLGGAPAGGEEVGVSLGPDVRS
jgi:hypothetical protein